LYQKFYQISLFILFLFFTAIFADGIKSQEIPQELPKVQVLYENLQPGESHYFDIPNLSVGDTLYVNIENLSGNLDPILGITKDNSDFRQFEEYFAIEIPEKIEKGGEFAEIFPDFADNFFITWDDNSGVLSDASITFRVPESGDYQLVVAGTYYQLQRGDKYYNTFGKYRLNIGVNAPEVLKGNAKATGDKIVSQIGVFNKRVQEEIIELSEERDYVELSMNNLDKSNTLYVYAESISGDLIPALKLRDYGNRLLAFDNLMDEKNTASLQYKLKDGAENYSLIIRADHKNKKNKSGKIRLLIGTNTPEILSGKSNERGRPILNESIEVEVSLLVDQISDINQTEENFTVVAYLIMYWQDDKFAYNPDKCKCNEIDFTREQFFEFIQEKNIDWPKFIILNQQGRRFIQEDNFRVYPDGEVKYFERFTVTLQAPDFDFRKFPFDPQKFFVRIMSLNAVDYYNFIPNYDLPLIGDHLGEEEWVVTNYESFVRDKKVLRTHSEYILEIDTVRHIKYYMFRIFLPLLLIIVVSWGTFFMKDYSNRIMVSVSNLLIFVAFNFSIGSDLPRLGYMTFMDGILFGAFLITAITVLINVFFRRLEILGHEDLAQNIDGYATNWYPVVYIATIAFLVLIFLYSGF
jgi:hypothetical protein